MQTNQRREQPEANYFQISLGEKPVATVQQRAQQKTDALSQRTPEAARDQVFYEGDILRLVASVFGAALTVWPFIRSKNATKSLSLMNTLLPTTIAGKPARRYLQIVTLDVSYFRLK